MSYTKKYDVAQGAWTKVIDGQATGVVQALSAGPVLVHVGPTASPPAVDSVDALELTHEGLRGLTFSSLDALDSVWCRSLHDETNEVAAHSSGTVPV